MLEQAAAASTRTSTRPSRGRWYVLLMISAMYLITYLDRVNISTAAPLISSEYGFDKITMGFIFSAFVWAYAMFQVPGGWLSDKLGARGVLASIVTYWSIMTAATAGAFNAVSFIVVRFLFGVGEAGAFPGATRAMQLWYPQPERGFVQGITHSASRLGAAIAPPLVVLIMSQWGWRAVFLICGAVGVIVGNFIYPRMQGHSLNIDPVVVLLALAFWGAIWGVAGAFLSTPLTVMIMVILAQFEGTRWIAVLFGVLILAVIVLAYMGHSAQAQLQADLAKAQDQNKLLSAQLDQANARLADLKGNIEVTQQKVGMTQAELAKARSRAESIRNDQIASDQKLATQLTQVQKESEEKIGAVATEVGGAKKDIADTRTDIPARFMPHTSFTDPTTPPDARPRESIELRTLVFHPA